MLGDNNRNSLIKAYRELQGLLYVPPSAHKALRWSKNDSLLEPEIHNFGWHIAGLTDDNKKLVDRKTMKDTVQLSNNPTSQKRVHDEIMTPEKQKNAAGKVTSPPHKIIKDQNTNNSHVQLFNHALEGFEWSENSYRDSTNRHSKFFKNRSNPHCLMATIRESHVFSFCG